ncbi:hypothetical protein GCM10020358_84430 [Amorphoplanes nipponensis]
MPETGGDDAVPVEDDRGLVVVGAAGDVDCGSGGADGAGDSWDGAGDDVAAGGVTGPGRACATATPPETRATATMPATVAAWAMVRRRARTRTWLMGSHLTFSVSVNRERKA